MSFLYDLGGYFYVAGLIALAASSVYFFYLRRRRGGVVLLKTAVAFALCSRGLVLACLALDVELHRRVIEREAAAAAASAGGWVSIFVKLFLASSMPYFAYLFWGMVDAFARPAGRFGRYWYDVAFTLEMMARFARRKSDEAGRPVEGRLLWVEAAREGGGRGLPLEA